MKKPKVIKSPLKFEEMTNDKLIEEVFGTRLSKKLKKIAHSDKTKPQSNDK